MIGAAFALIALVYAVQGVLCALVWRQLSDSALLEPGESIDLTPFPGGMRTMHVLWVLGLIGAAAVLIQVIRPVRPVLGLLAIAAAGLGSYGIWETPARPFDGDQAFLLVPGVTDLGFDTAALLCLLAVGCAAFGLLMAKPRRQL